MVGFSSDQGVPLHRDIHQLGASTNNNKLLYRLNTVACTGLLAQPRWSALERWPLPTILYN